MLHPLELSYDEFTEDVEENRLIKAATFVLSKTKNMDQELRRALRVIDNKLEDVNLVQYDPSNLPEINYLPNLNEYYRPAVDLAKFVLKNLIWTIQHGE
jgi:5-methylcytosine-specific restriction enzyme subunit McrC